MFDVAFSDIPEGVYIQMRKKAGIFNVAHFTSKSKSVSKVVRQLFFADDSALVSHTLNDIQTLVDRFVTAEKKFCPLINIKKTECLFQPLKFINKSH